MQREGSPWTGLWAVAAKEAADHLTSARMKIVLGLVFLTAIGAAYGSAGQLKETVGSDPFLFLRLFTTAREPLPSFAGFLGFLLPLVAITLAFDAINGEYQRRTMSRILSQPIYRDALLAGKFLGGLVVLSICVITLWLLVTGVGILSLGLPPSGEEVARGIAFLVVSVAYSAIWLGIALLFSTWFRSTATAALAALALWLLFTVFWPMLAPLVAGALAPVDPLDPMTALTPVQPSARPSATFADDALRRDADGHPAPLHPGAGPAVPQPDGRRALMGAPLPLDQSLLIIWPDFSGLVAGIVLVFTLAYVSFQRQEVRA